MTWQRPQAAWLMLAAVVFFSTNAVFVDLALGEANPFLFNSLLGLGLAVGVGTYLAAAPSPGNGAYGSMWKRLVGATVNGVRRPELGAALACLVGARFGFALYAAAVQTAGASVTSVLHFLWPVFAIVWLAGWDRTRRRSRYERLGLPSGLAIGVAFAGTALVIVGAVGVDGAGRFSATMLGGVFAVAAGGLVAAYSTLSYMLGARLHDEFSTGQDGPSEHQCVLFVGCVGDALGVAASALVGVAVGGSYSWELAVGGVLVGLTFAPGRLLSTKAVLVTPDLSIMALIYLTPLLSQLWLWLFSSITAARIDLLLAGAAALTVANMWLAYQHRPEAT